MTERSGSVERLNRHNLAIKVTLAYFMMASIWVVLTGGNFMGLAAKAEDTEFIQIAKSWIPVVVTAALLFILTKRSVDSLRESANALSRSENKYRKILSDAAEGIIIVNQEGVIEFVNSKTEQLFSYDLGELLGKKIEILVPESMVGIHKEHSRNYMKAPRNRPMGEALELQGRRKDGSLFPVEISLSHIVIDNDLIVLAYISDITERKQAEEMLRAERDRAQTYLDVAAVMMIALDLNKNVILINKKGCEILGYSEEEIIGQNWFDKFIPSGYKQELESGFDRFIHGKLSDMERFQNPVKTKGGEERLIQWYNTLIRNSDGRISGSLSSGEDITELKRAEEKAEIQQKNLLKADKMVTLGILVSGMAHEINNPNNYILLNGNIISKVWRDLTPVLEEYYRNNGDFAIAGMPYTKARDKLGSLIEGITEGATRIQKIVNNLKDFAREDTGDLSESVDINKVVESAIVIVGNLIKKSTDNFTVNLAEGLPPVRGNFQLLEQVVINLITNACQALPSADRRLTVSTGFKGESGHNYIKVEDQGEGISEANMERIMDPFFTTKREVGGTGLGLSISYNIIKDHDGEITVNSEQEKGTTIIVSLPPREHSRLEKKDGDGDKSTISGTIGG